MGSKGSHRVFLPLGPAAIIRHWQSVPKGSIFPPGTARAPDTQMGCAELALALAVWRSPEPSGGPSLLSLLPAAALICPSPLCTAWWWGDSWRQSPGKFPAPLPPRPQAHHRLCPASALSLPRGGETALGTLFRSRKRWRDLRGKMEAEIAWKSSYLWKQNQILLKRDQGEENEQKWPRNSPKDAQPLSQWNKVQSKQDNIRISDCLRFSWWSHPVLARLGVGGILGLAGGSVNWSRLWSKLYQNKNMQAFWPRGCMSWNWPFKYTCKNVAKNWYEDVHCGIACKNRDKPTKLEW